MNKEEQLLINLRDVLNKMAWLNKPKMEVSLKGHKSSEVHCIEAIGKSVDPNVTKLAYSLYMTRGAISRLTKKLLDKELIESYKKPDNKKEIYFRLTAKGKDVFQTHEQLHEEFLERDRDVFEQITDDQYNSMLSFLENYNEHLDVEIKKQSSN